MSCVVRVTFSARYDLRVGQYGRYPCILITLEKEKHVLNSNNGHCTPSIIPVKTVLICAIRSFPSELNSLHHEFAGVTNLHYSTTVT